MAMCVHACCINNSIGKALQMLIGKPGSRCLQGSGHAGAAARLTGQLTLSARCCRKPVRSGNHALGLPA